MRRRDFVCAALSIGVAPRLLLAQQAPGTPLPAAAPVPWTLGLNPSTPLPHTAVEDTIAQPDRIFFSALQMETLCRLCDVLLPPVGGKPGALDAQTPLFLDFLIGQSEAPRQHLYSGGLDWLNEQARTKFGKSFANVSDTEAGAMLKPWLRTWMADHPPLEAHAEFVNIAHDDIRQATINSQPWSAVASTRAEQSTETALYWLPIEPDLKTSVRRHLSVPAPAVRSARNAKSFPEYSR